MLVFFAMENFRSIKERQEFSFLPSAFFKESQETLLECDAVPGGKLLPWAVIYGPNASGKSNVIKGLRYLLSAVQRSHAQGKPDGGVPRTHFLLSRECAERPTTIDVEFVIDGVRYPR